MPEAESFEDHLRVMIRYACAMLLRRAQQLDVPHLIMHKFLPVATAHIHIYMKARSKCKSLSLSLFPPPRSPPSLITHSWIHKHTHSLICDYNVTLLWLCVVHAPILHVCLFKFCSVSRCTYLDDRGGCDERVWRPPPRSDEGTNREPTLL